MKNPNKRIILIHGLYMNRLAMKPLASVCHQHHFETTLFAYPSMLDTVAEHAAKLTRYIQLQKLPCAIIAHSLGGVVTKYALEQTPDLPITHVVALGVPFKGAEVVSVLQKLRLGKLIGRVERDLLPHEESAWQHSASLGLVTGTSSVGLGRLLLGKVSGDGTVSTEESLIEGYTDHVALPYSHTGMLFQSEVAKQAVHFIQNERFMHRL